MVDSGTGGNASCGSVDSNLIGLGMEVARRNKVNRASKRDLMLQTWQGLGHPRVGKPELRQIQTAVSAAFGPEGAESPAAIARVLADEGAELVHPEVIECDARWRESQIDRQEEKFAVLRESPGGESVDLQQAEVLIARLESLRQQFEQSDDRAALHQLITLAGEARKAAESNARNKASANKLRAIQTEVAEWLKIWIQTPNLFADWLVLRKSSLEFRRKFSTRDLPGVE